MMGEIRRLTRLLIGSGILFLLLTIANGITVSAGWYCAVCR